MLLTEKIFSGLEKICSSKNMRKNKGYVAASMIFDFRHYNAVQKKLNFLLDEIAKSGERISCEISSGAIVDSGIRQFDVLKGVSIEFYDYEKMSAAFIRLYCISNDKKRWVALYIDENPSTLWWSRAERE